MVKSSFKKTRGFNDATGETTGQRTKEEANDYRYFPCPDLLPIEVSQAWLHRIMESMPKLPSELLKEKQEKYGLTAYEAEIITESRDLTNYFIEASEQCKNL